MSNSNTTTLNNKNFGWDASVSHFFASNNLTSKLNFDIVVEGGLGTIHAVASAQTDNPYYYDDEDYSSNVSTRTRIKYRR